MGDQLQNPRKAPLHLATNIDDLNKLIVNKPYGRKLSMLCHIADKVAQQSFEISGQQPIDEERLYILSQRYFNLLANIKNEVNDETFLESRFSSNASKMRELRYATLESLLLRYNKQNVAAVKPVIIRDPECFTKTQLMKYKLPERDIFITAAKFYNLLCEFPEQVLVFDIRPIKDSKECYLKFPTTVFVPSNKALAGLTTNSLQMFLSEEDINLFKRRKQYDLLILMDIDTERIGFRDSKLHDLRVILTEWDIDQRTGLPPYVLEGGMKSLADSYPTLLTQPTKFYTFVYGEFGDFLNEDIDYPDLLEYGELVDPNATVAVQPTEEDNRTTPADSPSPSVGKVTPEFDAKQNLLNLCQRQLRTEDTLFKYYDRRFQLLKNLAEGKADRTQTEPELAKLDEHISKTESYYIELEERKKLMCRDNEELCFTSTEDVFKAIESVEKERLEKYEARKILLQKERDFEMASFNDNDAIYMDSESGIVAPKRSKPPRSKRPGFNPVPDRSTKPPEMTPLQRELKLIQITFHSRGEAGLINIRNTCYMNSLIQCLRFCPHFTSHFITAHYNEDNHPISVAVGNLVINMWHQTSNAVRPTYFYNTVCSLEGGQFSTGQHEDAQEFYIFLIKNMHSEGLEPFKRLVGKHTARLRDWRKAFGECTSFANRAFFFQLEGSSVCPKCNAVVVKYDYGNTIFISLPENGSAIDLQDKIDEFFQIKDDDTFVSKFCSSCECVTAAQKLIGYYPPILAINIVRYTFNKNDQCINRLNNACHYPLKISFCKAEYELRSISLHTGNRDKGHYTAVAYHPFAKHWVIYNDEFHDVVDINEPKFRIQCYMLFYTLAPGSDDISKNYFHS